MEFCTNLEQSQKLERILPLSSADMGWNLFVDDTKRVLPIDDWALTKDGSGGVKFYHAWSLEKLLKVLPYPCLEQNYNGNWVCKVEYKDTTYLWEDNSPIDACVEVIFKLHNENEMGTCWFAEQWLEKQGNKPQGKKALEAWKDMRLEVYQQANGNRHEPNYSDDSTKMFSLNDIDEIVEKIAEKQGELKPNLYSGVSFEYNGNIWGMCARDNGVEIIFDGELKAFLSSEKSFIYPIHPQQELAPKSALEAIKEEKADNANKIEPKFNINDWICNSACIVHIASIKDGMYYFDEGDGLDIIFVDNNYHLWSIADVKCGDVLVASDESLFIFARTKGDAAYYHFSLCKNGSQEISDGKHAWEVAKDCRPATQKQRDTLMKAMAKAGYEWDDKEKKPIKIETSLPSFDEQQGTPVVKQNPQPKEWSEEDENNLTDTCVAIRKFYHRNNGAQDLIDWLKSIKERVIWKPSKEQIIALRWVLNNIPYNTHKEAISGLLDQIKDL